MRDAIEEGNYIHSIDLQSATDRIPALLSRAVLNTVSSNYVAEL